MSERTEDITWLSRRPPSVLESTHPSELPLEEGICVVEGRERGKGEAGWQGEFIPVSHHQANHIQH